MIGEYFTTCARNRGRVRSVNVNRGRVRSVGVNRGRVRSVGVNRGRVRSVDVNRGRAGSSSSCLGLRLIICCVRINRAQRFFFKASANS